MRVDKNDNVWLAAVVGNGAKPVDPTSSWTTNKDGADGFVLKFDMDGNFKMRIGGTPNAPASNDTNGGINGTPLLYLPADMVVDGATGSMSRRTAMATGARADRGCQHRQVYRPFRRLWLQPGG